MKKTEDRNHPGAGFPVSDLTEHGFLSRRNLETTILILGVCSYELCSALERCLFKTNSYYFHLVAFPVISI